MQINRLSQYVKLCILLMIGASQAACTWIMDGENLEGCPTGDFVVQFVYDYNIQRADMFRDHVGEVRLYVFDEAGALVTERYVSDAAALADRDHRFQITLKASNVEGAADLVAGHKYRFLALAGQRANAIIPTEVELPYQSDFETAKYRYTALGIGQSVNDLSICLDRSLSADPFGRYAVSNQAPMDTLWHTLGVLPMGAQSTNVSGWNSDTLVTIRTNIVDSINVVRFQPEDTLTISLIRNTNHLHISLHELDAPSLVKAEDYQIYIEDANGRHDWRNNVLPDIPLIYRPYASRTEDMEDAGIPGTSGQWDMMFNRLIYHEHAADDAHLYIVHVSGDTIARLSLPRVLAYNRIANDYYGLTQQGYLDREYNYNMSFFLQNGSWKHTEIYVATEVNILSWAIRAEEVLLGEDL